MNKYLEPMRERRKYYEEHPEILDEILIKGTNEERKKSKEVMGRIKNSMKIDYFDN